MVNPCRTRQYNINTQIISNNDNSNNVYIYIYMVGSNGNNNNKKQVDLHYSPRIEREHLYCSSLQDEKAVLIPNEDTC